LTAAARTPTAAEAPPASSLVARDLRRIPLERNPKRNTLRASFDELGGNTTLSVLLTEFGAERVGHRHLDEATTFIVSGRGWTEVRPHADGPETRVEWAAGEVFAIPTNAWHRHHAEPPEPARQLTFKTTALMNRLFGSRDFIRANTFEFADRYDDSTGWTRAVPVASRSVASERPALPDHFPFAPGVRPRRLDLAGQQILEGWAIELPPAGVVQRHAHLAEEMFVVVEGTGRTTVWGGSNASTVIEWSDGDLISPPLGLDHEHVAGDAGAMLLLVRNVFVERALGTARAGLMLRPQGEAG
jgi:quercetin dioxygenase-like cupin family protein